jgi:hypothetical protein
VPELWYFKDDKSKHRHFVDIFVQLQNRCIEIKSTYTYKINKDDVLAKQRDAKKDGYLYEIWVFDQKGNIIEKLM